ncbi:hypothetical protein BDR07DRAFT_1401578 [Suillus spraguei]|nr:hypothetical protein BDR07DRAFT_1401578 [Suillus spraguei]
MQSATTRHVRTLLILSVVVRLAVWILVSISAYLLPLFDASPCIWISGTPPGPPSVLLRWDAFHFAHIAREGYVYEHEWAFSALAGFGSSGWGTLLRGGAGMAILCDSTHVLYHLSLHHFRSPSLAFLSAALSVFSSSPAALKLASYNEPFFTYFSYRGMLACARSNWVAASICFALASMFRSNGIFLSGFILWGMLVTPFLTWQKDRLTPRRLLKCVLLTALPLIPFIHHNITAYLRFCRSSATSIPDWCTSNMIPLIYSHTNEVPSPPQLDSPFLSPALLPHISLRLLPSLPLTYWAGARLILDLPKWGKAWVTWSVLWGALSCVLWAVFLPPA